jgi:hypothetical protein
MLNLTYGKIYPKGKLSGTTPGCFGVLVSRELSTNSGPISSIDFSFTASVTSVSSSSKKPFRLLFGVRQRFVAELLELLQSY